MPAKLLHRLCRNAGFEGCGFFNSRIIDIAFDLLAGSSRRACFIISVSVVPIIGCVENRRWGDRALPYSGPSRTRRNHTLPDVTIVYWRDIPAQVIVGKGRRGAKRQLPERFEQAIDRAAMKVNAKDSDAYLAEWRKADPYVLEGEAEAIAEAEAVRLDAEYDQDRIKALIENDGWA